MGLRRAYRRWRGSPAPACEPMRSANPQGHLLITGTGRAGTTLMMRIMINLGLDTGFRPEDIPAAEANIARAGLEHELKPDTADRLPAIIKTPLATDILHEALGKGWLNLWHTFIPVRNLQDAANSRRAAQRKADALGLDRATAPGDPLEDRRPPDARTGPGHPALQGHRCAGLARRAGHAFVLSPICHRP